MTDEPDYRKTRFSKRIIDRAAGDVAKQRVLLIADRQEVRDEMFSCVGERKKPIVALSAPMIEELGLEAARDHGLKRFAGEATAYVVETDYGCVRVNGNRSFVGDPVFESGQPFMLPPSDGGDGELPSVTDVLISILDDHQLAALKSAVARELERRLAA
jgi:hypothetical protein